MSWMESTQYILPQSRCILASSSCGKCLSVVSHFKNQNQVTCILTSCLLSFPKIGMPSFLRSVLWNVDLWHPNQWCRRQGNTASMSAPRRSDPVVCAQTRPSPATRFIIFLHDILSWVHRAPSTNINRQWEILDFMWKCSYINLTGDWFLHDQAPGQDTGLTLWRAINYSFLCMYHLDSDHCPLSSL